MFFLLSKILGFFASPSNFIFTLGVLGVLLLPTRFARAGRRLAATCLVVLAIIGISPLGNALILPLEQRFPAWDALRGAPDGIVVLGGAVTPDVASFRKVVALNEAAERMTATIELANRYPAARIIFTGGDSGVTSSQGSEAEAATLFFDHLGLAPGRVIMEDKARNTVENAVFSKALAMPKPGERWLLVTSAYHMPRAIGVFRAAGFAVEPYPVDWRTRGADAVSAPFATAGDGLRRTDTAVREWVGLAIYRLTGKTSALFPGP
jgi:uncharacterized SAM-binding protein YcdF (DUF218 family)